MTLLEIRNQMYSYFLGRTIFDAKTDIDELSLGEEFDKKDGKMRSYKERLVKSALNDLVKANVVSQLDDNVFILIQPLISLTQNVSISPYTSSLVAHAFNSFTRHTGGIPRMADKMAITDIEIQALAHVCFAFYEQIETMAEKLNELSSEDEFGAN